MKYLCDMKDWDFSKKHSLLSNIEFLSRRMYREGVRHLGEKPKSKNIGEAAFHGVTACKNLQFARILKTIAKELKAEKK